MNKPKVSIVVPIYGVEKYLHQCVDSILAQTLKDIEIILVDDGSKDKCPEIVDEYAKKDPRVVAVHQPNGGYGRAVNHGIEIATGEYIGIIESDDWIEPTMYEKMYTDAKKNNTDITKCEFYIYNSKLVPKKQNKIWKSKVRDLDHAPNDVFNVDEWPLITAFHASIWSNLYRADFIKGQKVIETRSASYQDFPFMIEAMCRAKRIYVIKEPLVHYRVEEGQNSSTVRRDERLMKMADQCFECKKIAEKYGKYNVIKEAFCFQAVLCNYYFYQAIEWKYKRSYFNKIHDLFSSFDMDNNFGWIYFENRHKEFVQRCLKNEFLRSLGFKYLLRTIRRFFISIHLSNNGFCFQFFGIQIAKGTYTLRPAFIKFTTGGKNE